MINIDLTRLILEKTDLTQKQVEYACNIAVVEKDTPTNILLKQNLLTNNQLCRILAEHYHILSTDLPLSQIDPAALSLLPEAMARRHQIIAFGYNRSKKAIKIASCLPLNDTLIKSLHAYTHKTIIPYLTTKNALLRALSLYHQPKIELFRQKIEKITSDFKTDQIATTQELFKTILTFALNQKLSILNFHQTGKNIVLHAKFDDVNLDLLTLPLEIYQTLLHHIETSAHFFIHSPLPKLGRFKVVLGGRPSSIKAIFTPSYHGSNLTLRLLAVDKPMKLTELGLSDDILSAVKNNFRQDTGILLIASPPMGGKTTTYYAALAYLNKAEINISTIEESIEYSLDRINQTQVNPSLGMGFYSGLKAIANQDPDILGVGELVGPKTGQLAFQYANSNKQLIATMAAETATSAIQELLKMGIEPHLIASPNNLFLAQRLARKNCPRCRLHYEIGFADLEPVLMALAPDEIRHILNLAIVHKSQTIHLARGKGCSFCRYTGYDGLTGVFEALVVTPALSELILQKASLKDMQYRAIMDGFCTLGADALYKAVSGLIPFDEVVSIINTYSAVIAER